MASILNDRQIEALINESSEDIKIPDAVELGFQNSYREIKRISRKKSWTKTTAAAAILFLLLAVSFVKNPAFADELEAIKNLIKGTSYFGLNGSMLWGPDSSEKLERYSSEIGAESNDKGITIKVKEAVYDGRDIYLVYIIQGEAPIKDTSASMLPMQYEGKKIDIKGLGLYATGEGREEPIKISENTFVCKETISLKPFTKTPKSLNINMEYTKLAGIEGNWKLNFKVSMDNMKDKIKNLRPNQTINFTDDKYKATYLQISPITSRLQIQKTNSFSKIADRIFRNKSSDSLGESSKYILVLEDDKGRGLQSYESAGNSNGITIKREISFKLAEEKVPEFINVTPVKKIAADISDFYKNMTKEQAESGVLPNDIYKQYKSSGTMDKLPVTLDNGKFGRAVIHNLVENDKHIELYITIDSKYSSLYDFNILIYDKSKDKLNTHSYFGGKSLQRVGDKEFKLVLDKENEKLDMSRLKDYEIMGVQLEKKYEVSGEEVKIKVKK